MVPSSLDQSALDQLVACPLCDTLSYRHEPAEGQVVVCNRCHQPLYANKRNALQRSLALAIAGLCLVFPALTLPLIGLSAFGVSNQMSLIEGLLLLIQDDFYVIACCLFLFTIAVPLLRLVVVAYILVRVFQHKVSYRLRVIFRCYRQLDSWGMLHVYILGIVVSMYKLVSMAELTFGLGIFSLSLLLLCSMCLSLTLDVRQIWHHLEQGDANET